ncbi:fused DSP-PTPase phosphatase/NAD kinase-like protein [Pseudodesulfovibrio methanolicus]|uniref:Tyrosine-protein phosphatase n=1 Tax=Pseudodesulfovibrio methanolicus TaxID=3126690 RepID=A0ABZ2J2A1_9BACT
MTFRRKSFLRTAAATLGVLAVLFAARVWYLEEQGNFHAITVGEAYRSAQLDRDELAHYVRRHHIRSIINLRGDRPEKAWYREEIATARELGIRHFDFGGIRATRAPSPRQVHELLELFAMAPRPVLLHCRAGADRSGLAAALWKTMVDGAPASEARKQLSLRYGHVPVGPTTVLDAFFDHWNPAEGRAVETGIPAPAHKEI